LGLTTAVKRTLRTLASAVETKSPATITVTRSAIDRLMSGPIVLRVGPDVNSPEVASAVRVLAREERVAIAAR
jgi:hypothetical protein